jgi:hypothetical protein
MPEFNFYFNDAERRELVEFILSKGTQIVADSLYPSKKFEVISSLEDYNNAMENEKCKYFLLDSSYTTEPLDFQEIDFDEGSKFKISQRVGGPYIDLFFFSGYSDDAEILFKRSWLDHYARFLHQNSNDEYKVSEELKTYYKDIVRYIKSKCNSIKKNGSTYWISNEVLEEMNLVK